MRAHKSFMIIIMVIIKFSTVAKCTRHLHVNSIFYTGMSTAHNLWEIYGSLHVCTFCFCFLFSLVINLYLEGGNNVIDFVSMSHPLTV